MTAHVRAARRLLLAIATLAGHGRAALDWIGAEVLALALTIDARKAAPEPEPMPVHEVYWHGGGAVSEYVHGCPGCRARSPEKVAQAEDAIALRRARRSAPGRNGAACVDGDEPERPKPPSLSSLYRTAAAEVRALAAFPADKRAGLAQMAIASLLACAKADPDTAEWLGAVAGMLRDGDIRDPSLWADELGRMAALAERPEPAPGPRAIAPEARVSRGGQAPFCGPRMAEACERPGWPGNPIARPCPRCHAPAGSPCVPSAASGGAS